MLQIAKQVFLDFGEQNKAIITLNGSNFSVDNLAYGSDGLLLATGTISGSYSSSSITGSIIVGGDVISSFSFSLSDESSYGASLDSSGSQYNGNITIPDSSVNVYRVVLNASDYGDFNDKDTGLTTYVIIK